MSSESIGVALALGTALCWSLSAMAFEEVSRRAGSVPVNLLRLVVAFGMLALARLLTVGSPLPTGASPEHWGWLLLSGLMGFFVGDLAAFRALVLIGARLTTLIACTAPILALAAERLILSGTDATPLHALGALITCAGVAWVVLERRAGDPVRRATPPGVLLALAGAAGQGVGAVLTARAFALAPYDALGANQIRMLAGLAGFAIFVAMAGRARDTLRAARDGPAMGFLTLGALMGPFLGVSMFIQSLRYVQPSVTQTLAGLSPVVIIPLVVVVRRERVSIRAMAGAMVAVAGVWLLIRGSSAGPAG